MTVVSGAGGTNGVAGAAGLVGLIGQEEVVDALRAAVRRPTHAYLFVGPPGTGKTAAAFAFAAMLVCPDGGEDSCETCSRVERGVHPDVVVFEREGPFLSIDQAREVTRVAARSSVEGGRTILVLPEVHLARDSVPALLKTIEEPPPSTVFIILADFLSRELLTVASRCTQVFFRPVSEEAVAAKLVAEGVPAAAAQFAAAASGGRLDRARLLATDPEAQARRRAWEAVPARLDGSGATVSRLAEELVLLVDRSLGPLVQRQEREAAARAEAEDRAISSRGGKNARGTGKAAAKELEERHRREQRRYRSEELRSGLAALAWAYRDRVADGRLPAGEGAEAVRLIDGFSADLAYNPGELLCLQALLVRLGKLARQHWRRAS